MHLTEHDVRVPWGKVVLWTVLFQIAWNWRRVPDLLFQGAMPDADDFMRLAQVRAWMNGQGWYDLLQYRLDPPAGASIHWSRIVDLPIAALTWFFSLFADETLAFRLTALVWPTLLLIGVALLLTALCRAVADRFNPLLPVLFTVTCLSALTEFLPGRIDHHSVQILLFCIALLGIADAKWHWGHFAAGAAIASSFAIGLDAFLISVVLLAWIGLQWALLIDADGSKLRQVAGGLIAASLVLYPLFVPPAFWLSSLCDANSPLYLTGLLAIAAGYLVLSWLSRFANGQNRIAVSAIRIAFGAVVGGACVALLWVLFPQCAAGPLSAMSVELNNRWLVNVFEAMSVFRLIEKVPELWFTGVFYPLFLLAIGLVVLVAHGRRHPGLLAIYGTLLLSALVALFQYRTLRIGIFASVPLCVLFVTMAMDWARDRFPAHRLASGISGALAVLLCLSPAWFIAAKIMLPAPASTTAVESSTATKQGENEPQYDSAFCNRQEHYEVLASLPKGLVLSDINTGAPAIVFTYHDAVGGPYHRNERAILDMADFFETDEAKALEVVRKRGANYVAYCDSGEQLTDKHKGSPAMAIRILDNREPEWLVRLSRPGDRLRVFRIEPNKAG